MKISHREMAYLARKAAMPAAAKMAASVSWQPKASAAGKRRHQQHGAESVSACGGGSGEKRTAAASRRK